MARWSDVEAQAPELVALARGLLDAHAHKTIATLRKDGAPRISGIECFERAGELWIGSMGGAMKARDLQRDPRYALHSGSADPPVWKGDAKLSGRAEEVTDPGRIAAVFERTGDEAAEPDSSHLFRLDVTELSVVRLGEPPDHLVIESWHAGRGVSSLRR